jgi:hypothetical protein
VLVMLLELLQLLLLRLLLRLLLPLLTMLLLISQHWLAQAVTTEAIEALRIF